MKRDDFINELERLLRDIPEGDRIDAIEYYYDYFEEAGEGNEEKVIRELGSPERVAQTIKENFGATRAYNTGDYSEPEDYREPRDYSEPYDEAEPREYEDFHGSNTTGETSQGKNSSRKTPWPLIVIVAILTFPIWIGVVAGLFGGIVGLIGGLFGLVIGLIGAAFGLVIGGIACCVAILFKAAVVGPAEVMVTLGVGALLVALGLLLTLLGGWIAGKWIPSLVKLIVKGVKSLLNRK